MKIKDVLKSLEHMYKTYGDLDVTITMENGGIIKSTTEIYFGYNQYEDHNEIDIRDFPY